MKILQIRLKNLNSLVGAWEIDLTHPAYEAGGIFAIIGPTGAGKTTILDALCLALYGRTPRLSKVSKGVNDIMSRQTGECSAEVTFATQSGRYCCTWSQRRAHRKVDGELQAPKHEISNLDTGEVVETKLRGVAEQIELFTGMDFDRFTRSMLLAQGGFAAFLQAAADERAPILEQITGTGIYSQISMKVHERRLEERRRLDVLQAELAGMQLLGEEELRRLQAELVQLSLRETGVSEAAAETSRAIAWLETLSGLEKELAVLEAANENLAGRRQNFEPQRLQLERALQALELAGEYSALESLRRAQNSDLDSHRECLGSRPSLQAGITRTQEDLQQAAGALTRIRVEQKDALPLIRQARHLDLQLREKLQPITTATEAVAIRQKNLDLLRAKILDDNRRLGEHGQALQSVQHFLDENRADEGLVSQFAAICARFDVLRSLGDKRRSRISGLEGIRRQTGEARRLWQDIAGHQEKLQKEYSMAQETSDMRQGDMKNLLAGRDAADWREDLSALKEKTTVLQQLWESARTLTETCRQQGELSQAKERLTIEQAGLVQGGRELTDRQAAFERELGLLETQLSLLKRIDDLTEARQQLRDDEPCPLCGALQHPYAVGNIPVPDETQKALQKVRADLKQVAADLSRLKVQEAGIRKDLEHTALRQKDCAETIEREEKVIGRGMAELGLVATDRTIESCLLKLRQENAGSLKEVEGRVRAIDQCEKESAAARDSLEKIREAMNRAEREAQAAAHRKETSELALVQAEKDRADLEAEITGLSREIGQEIQPYGVIDLSMEVLGAVQEKLSTRREAWQDAVSRKNELERHIAALEISIRHGAAQIAADEGELRARHEALTALVAERDLLAGQRRELFAGKDPDAEENRLQALVEGAEKSRQAAERMHAAALQEMEKLQNRLEIMEKAMAERSEQLRTMEAAFALRLQQNGFADEKEYLAACLPEDRRLSLIENRDRLDREKAQTEARWRDKTQQLAAERQKGLTDQPHPQLLQKRDEYLLALKTLQQEIGGIRGRLGDNERLREKQQARAEAVERQNREYRRWDLLHGLIGSADGKKYRNFAQGLTFEMMIGYANRQLRKMSDRYLLLRDEIQPLDLNVVDGYQAGEIRSTRNLSGGESFLVSLSLALGLSQMASRNVRVDSLFLDEGFGTLDEDALDTALQTLAGLQQDGKLIGVISHVPALRERIGTRIQVSSRTGGRSVIQGPGCRRREEK